MKSPTVSRDAPFWLALLFMGACFAPNLLLATGNKSTLRVQRRIERLETVEETQKEEKRIETETWADERIRLNLRYRVPVIEAVGFCALLPPANQDFPAFLEAARAIDAELELLATQHTYVGRDLPPAVERRTDALRQTLYAAVETHFGGGARQDFVEHLRQLQGALKRDGKVLAGTPRY
ncbi:MAG: hypothetical protein ACFBZ8_12995 [Opitutales bacterium]